MPFGAPDIFEVKPITVLEDWHDDPIKKKLFGIALAKHPSNPFNAACDVFGHETSKALWASFNWLNDPVVLATQEEYSAQEIKLLDKDAFSLKLLETADQAEEDRDRITALKLYAEVRGWIGKTTVDLSTNNNFQNNELRILVVEPDKVEQPAIINNKNDDVEIEDDFPLKLVAVG